MTKPKVLIVDDEPRNQRIIVEVLEDTVEFQKASSGEEALSLLENFTPDLILLDIMMPGIDGYEVCKRVRTIPKLAFTKIILVSGKAMVEERLKGYSSGADDYMTKPFEIEELLAKSKVFLQLAQAQKQLGDINATLEEKIQERTQKLVETEAKLVTSAKMSALGEMAGGIAHEINTPLAIIGMASERIEILMTKETIDRKVAAEVTKTIKDTVKRISAIVKGLQTFSRDGSQDPFNAVSVNQIISSTLSLCKEKLKSGNVDLQTTPLGDDTIIQCRAVQISQVLLNLINNAYDAIQPIPDKWIQISVENKGTTVEISVTDCGSGISEETRKKIFQPFFTTKEVGKGTGLGLSISKGIVDSHRGTLEVDMNCKNTRFILKLPTGNSASK